MAEGWLFVWVLTVIFLATLIRSAFGFGEALVAVPLLALLIPVEVAAPLAVLVSITVALVIVRGHAPDSVHGRIGGRGQPLNCSEGGHHAQHRQRAERADGPGPGTDLTTPPPGTLACLHVGTADFGRRGSPSPRRATVRVARCPGTRWRCEVFGARCV
jgi:hypothetical protein